MKKNTFKNVSKKLIKYGVLSAAIAGVADVNGQVVYTDIADFTGGTSAGIGYSLDLNNDNLSEFLVDAIPSNPPSPGYAIIFNRLDLDASVLAYVPSNNSNNLNYPFAMNSNDLISSGQASWVSRGTLNYQSCYGGNGSSNWCGVTDKYLGLRFKIGGNTHYGWARLDVSASGDRFTIKDYAYNSTPDASINAGQGRLSVDDNSFNTIKIVALNKSIAISNITDTVDYNLFDISGKIVMSNQIKDNTHVIEANSVSTGVYILELKATNSDKIIRRKVVL